MSFIDLPIRKNLGNKVWGHVKRKFPDMTLIDAIDYALKEYMKCERDGN